MYRALYRKWRPRRFADVVGQEPIVTALQNQIAAGRVGHAYLFTGTRGTGKTTCAKIFAKAVNCLEPVGADPCGECAVCRGIDDGSILDVNEIDGASNNSVDDIRDLRSEANYLPAVCKYKVYIIDEAHMITREAFNALLKTMEEPPEHVIFILATTDVQRVPVTILSRCQRYDFQRITPEKIAGRLAYVAQQEGIELDPDAATLIARLADGAMRDALSILDTCAGVDNHVDEELVRRMAGVTDRQYLFAISDAVAAGDSVAALEKIAELRQKSVDMRRLCSELAGHYRNLMLAALPGGEKLLTGVAPEEEAAYAARRAAPQTFSVRAIQAFGRALENMSAGADARIELELAIFALTQPEQPVPAVSSAAPQPFSAAPAPQPFAAAPAAGPQTLNTAPAPASVTPAVPVVQSALTRPEPAAAPLPEPLETKAESAPSSAPAPAEPPTPAGAQPPTAAPAPAAPPPQAPLLFAQWPAVLALMEEHEPMLISFLRGSKAYYDGKRVLIDCSDAFRDYMRSSKDTAKKIKEYIYAVTKVRCGIGPYQPPQEAPSGPTLEQTMQRIASMGVDVEEQ